MESTKKSTLIIAPCFDQNHTALEEMIFANKTVNLVNIQIKYSDKRRQKMYILIKDLQCNLFKIKDLQRYLFKKVKCTKPCCLVEGNVYTNTSHSAFNNSNLQPPHELNKIYQF